MAVESRSTLQAWLWRWAQGQESAATQLTPEVLSRLSYATVVRQLLARSPVDQRDFKPIEEQALVTHLTSVTPAAVSTRHVAYGFEYIRQLRREMAAELTEGQRRVWLSMPANRVLNDLLGDPGTQRAAVPFATIWQKIPLASRPRLEPAMRQLFSEFLLYVHPRTLPRKSARAAEGDKVY